MSLESQSQRFIETLKELGGSAGNGNLALFGGLCRSGIAATWTEWVLG